jgi:hypothetical protein
MKTPTNALNLFTKIKTASLAALALTALATTEALAGDENEDGYEFKFDLVRSGGLPTGALPDAQGSVKIESADTFEIMDVKVWGLPPKTDFDFFVIQVPKAPFGIAWYQGDIETNRYGVGHNRFIGRFNKETFIVASRIPPAAPILNEHPFPDAPQNPATNPVQLYHLGLWFNDPQDAVKAGAAGTVTPFNGEHHAGVQVLNTSEFMDATGPLLNVTKSGN